MPSYRDPRDGRWRYRARVVLPTGKHKRISGSAPNANNTQKAADNAERLHVLRLTVPGAIADAPTMIAVSEPKKEIPTVKEFAERFMDEYLPRQKPTERKSKRRILDNKKGGLIKFFGGMRLDEIDQGHVNSYVRSLGVSAKTVNNRLTVLSTMLRYAHDLKLIAEPDLNFKIDTMDSEIVAVPADDVTKLIAACTDDRYRVAILLASEAGLRIGEIRGVQWTDVKNGRVTIRRALDPECNITPPKHNKSRTVPLSPALLDALKSLKRRGIWIVGKLDGDSIGYWTILEAVKEIYARAGVDVPKSETGRTMPWHSLRHTFGTELVARGVPLPWIKELMGHEDIDTTMRYVTVGEAQLDAAIEQAFGDAGQSMANTSQEPS